MKNQAESKQMQQLAILLDSIEDPRSQKLAVYSLREIFFLLIAGTLCGYDELTVIASYGREKLVARPANIGENIRIFAIKSHGQ